MSNERIKRFFGTDGIRGRVGKSPINAEMMLKLGWAAGRVLAKEGRRKVLIGKDTRISGYMFESALEAGLSSAGVDIALLGPMPTPAVAYLTRTLHAQAGIVISASHNPYYDNGIKFFSAEGVKLSDEIEFAIESELDREMHTVESAELGKAERIVDATGRYIEFCKHTIPTGVSFSGLKIVIDCAHGATYNIAPAVFEELGATVIKIGVEPDGLNINRGCGSTHPESLQDTVINQKADLGISFDGDGDRVIMVDHLGGYVDGDELLYIIARSRRDAGKLPGAVVGTLMSNLGLEQALSALKLPFHRTKVGDRYVMETLRKTGSILGGESSGHIICLDRATTGDGIVAALQVVYALSTTGHSLHELKKGMTKLPQTMINVTTERRIDFSSYPAITKAVKEAERKLSTNGRVLLRASGTEPVIRVMVEGSDALVVEKLAQDLAQVVVSSTH